MNVLFLDQYSALGGAQHCLLDLIPGIEARGWRAHAALPRGGPLVDLLRARGLPVDNIPCGPYRSGSKSAADLLRFAADVPLQIAKISALLDGTGLVYVNGPRLLLAAALASHGRVPILFHAHHAIEQRGAAYLEGLALRHSGATVAAISEATARPLRKWVPSARIHTIPNGSADLGFRERRFGQRMRIGIVGRIAPEKGQREFLRAAALLLPYAPHARFVICGAPLFSNRVYYDEVLSLASSLPVEFLDWQNDVAPVMHDLDVLVIPSRQEGMSRVLIEAFSAGLPVVAFPVGGIPEVIEDRVTGFLTPAASPEALAATLKEVLARDAEQLHTVTRSARRQWERRYTLARYREEITNLMEQCQLDENQRTAPMATPGSAAR
jgi:glycosyltransferase involved in cell wall biosynthesis